MRSTVLGLLFLGLLLGAVSCKGGSNSQVPTGVVFITVDGLVPVDISPFGGPISLPALDRLAKSGRVWSDVWTAVPMTRPAAATYLTGLAADRHGVLDDLHDFLPPDLPTLATAFQAAGYETAAFPESSAIAPNSGLLRGFTLVDPPPLKQEMLRRLTPRLRPLGELRGNFGRWLDTVPPKTKYFAWVHLARPFRAQTFDTAKSAVEALTAFDDDVAAILDSMAKRTGEPTVVVLVGTFGRVAELSGETNGLGTSLSESAIQVPLIVRADGVSSWRSADAMVWAPDIAVTLVELIGGELAGAEGVGLQRSAPERNVLSMSRAPLDQLGWTALSAVRRGSLRVSQVGGEWIAQDLNTPNEEVAPERVEPLKEALDRRPVPIGSRLAADETGELLADAGVSPNPVPLQGRIVPPGSDRDRIVAAVWESRRLNGFADIPKSMKSVREVLKQDPLAAQPMVDLGLYEIFGDPATTGGSAATGKEKIRRAVGLYPSHPEIWRWLALAVWADDIGTGERILRQLTIVRPRDPDLLYDIACARTRAGDLEAGEANLRSAIDAGFNEFEVIQVDSDLRALRESGRLAAILKDYR